MKVCLSTKSVKILPHREAEWLRDRMYERERQQEGIEQLINHYSKIKMEVERII